MSNRKKNPFGKSNFDAPHAIYEGHGPWGHQIIHVIKTYQHPDNERKNPYAKHLKKQVTIRMGVDIIDYFKELAKETGIPYQNLINLYLRDCVQSKRKISIDWTINPTRREAIS